MHCSVPASISTSYVAALPTLNTAEVPSAASSNPTGCNRGAESRSVMQLCAPREVVLQQMWREEDDGTFIVLLHSTKHRKASMPAPSWSWWQPIRAQVGPTPCPVLSVHPHPPETPLSVCCPPTSPPFAALLPPNFVPPVHLPSGLQPCRPSVTLIFLIFFSS